MTDGQNISVVSSQPLHNQFKTDVLTDVTAVKTTSPWYLCTDESPSNNSAVNFML